MGKNWNHRWRMDAHWPFAPLLEQLLTRLRQGPFYIRADATAELRLGLGRTDQIMQLDDELLRHVAGSVEPDHSDGALIGADLLDPRIALSPDGLEFAFGG